MSAELVPSLELRTATRVRRLAVIDLWRISNIEQDTGIWLVCILVCHACVAENSHLYEGVMRSVEAQGSRSRATYFNNTLEPKRFFVLYEQPRYWTTNLRTQKCFSFGFVHAELSAWPEGDVHVAIVLVHQSFQGDRPGVLVLDVEK